MPTVEHCAARASSVERGKAVPARLNELQSKLPVSPLMTLGLRV